MILAKTPYRVSLFGGGTDYPEWFEANGGFVLGMAINRYCYTGVKRMPPGQSMRYRVQYRRVDDCMEIAEIGHPGVRGILRYLKKDEPLEFHCMGDLPGNAGLGSSSSFVVGMLHAVKRLYHLLPGDLAAEATHIEREVIGEAVGCQDQIFAAHGGLLFVEFSRGQPRMREIRLSPLRLAELQACLVLAFTGTMRDAHPMAAKQIQAIGANDKTLWAMAEMARHGLSVLTDETQELAAVAEILAASWELKRRLAPDISNSEIDALYLRGLEAGAMGGKLLGAGGGGFMLFLVPPYVADFEARVGVPCIRPKIAWEGSRVIIDEP